MLLMVQQGMANKRSVISAIKDETEFYGNTKQEDLRASQCADQPCTPVLSIVLDTWNACLRNTEINESSDWIEAEEQRKE